MVTKRLQESGSPKQARPVATDSANGPLMLLRLREHSCGHCCRDRHQPPPVGPLALTLGAPAATDDVCRCCRARDADADAPALAPGVMPSVDSVLRGSRYLRPAQELLCDAVSAVGGYDDGESAEGGSKDEAALPQMRLRAAATSRGLQAKSNGGAGAGAVQAKLLSLLSELEGRQEHYFQELSRVASSFEPALGPAATAGYTSLMSRAMTRHFGNLRRAILRKLAAVTRPAPAPRATLWADEDSEEEDEDDDDECGYDPARQEDMVSRLVRRTKQAAAARAAEQVCKPLRGLPEESVAVLRAWLFNHFLDPYPSDNEKLRLAVSTGLSRRQISNWFINARVRLWKPMIEEMYADEFSEDSSAVSSRDDDAGAAASSQ